MTAKSHENFSAKQKFNFDLLSDTKGVLKQEWRKVKVKDHVAEVLDAVKALNK